MQDDPWSMFPSFDEALWLEQAKGVESHASNNAGLSLSLRGEKRLSWPVFPDKVTGNDAFPNAWELQQKVDSNPALIQALLHGAEGIRVDNPISLMELLDGVHLEMISVHLGGSFKKEWVQDLIARGADARLKGSWLELSSDEALTARSRVEHMKQVQAVFPLFRSWSCPSVRWLNDGVSGVQVIAKIGSSLNHLMSELDTEKAKVEATQRVVLDWVIGENVLLEIASLRALRLFWNRWTAFHKLPEIVVWINAVNCNYASSPVKYEDHLIPQTAGVYAAVIGGADGITALPHDAEKERGIGSDEGLRWARNVHHIMREESGLHRIYDPMGGSAVVESWTHSILDSAWNSFLLENEGEMGNKANIG